MNDWTDPKPSMQSAEQFEDILFAWETLLEICIRLVKKKCRITKEDYQELIRWAERSDAKGLPNPALRLHELLRNTSSKEQPSRASAKRIKKLVRRVAKTKQPIELCHNCRGRFWEWKKLASTSIEGESTSIWVCPYCNDPGPRPRLSPRVLLARLSTAAVVVIFFGSMFSALSELNSPPADVPQAVNNPPQAKQPKPIDPRDPSSPIVREVPAQLKFLKLPPEYSFASGFRFRGLGDRSQVAIIVKFRNSASVTLPGTHELLVKQIESQGWSRKGDTFVFRKRDPHLQLEFRSRSNNGELAFKWANYWNFNSRF